MAWCLTPTLNPSQHKMGPYPDLAEAQRKALQALSSEGKWAALIEGRMPNMLVPTYCKGHGPAQTINVIQPIDPHTVGPTLSRVHTRTRSPLKANVPMPPQLYRLKEQQLRYLCRQLSIPISNTADRAEIIATVERELSG